MLLQASHYKTTDVYNLLNSVLWKNALFQYKFNDLGKKGMCSPSPIIKSLGDSYLIYTENRNHLRVSLCVAGNLLVAYSVNFSKRLSIYFLSCPQIYPLYTEPKWVCKSLKNLCKLRRVWLFVTPWTVACQASLSMEFSRQEYSPPGDFPNLGVEPRCPALQADSLPSELPATPLRFILKEWYFLKMLNICLLLFFLG